MHIFKRTDLAMTCIMVVTIGAWAIGTLAMLRDLLKRENGERNR